MKRFYYVVVVLVTMMLTGLLSSLKLADSQVSPQSVIYPAKRTGEWFLLHFGTFGAVEKQSRRLLYSSRRAQEISMLQKAGYQGQLIEDLAWSYDKELSAASYMSEQLALLDSKFIVAIESVYVSTLNDLALADSLGDAGFVIFQTADRYNARAIKELVRRYRKSDTERRLFVQLIVLRLEYESGKLQDPLPAAVAQRARSVLEQGVELEWAFDLASGRAK